jgi:hypothetical protein
LKFSEWEIEEELATLRRGGPVAVYRFVSIARIAFEGGGVTLLSCWVALASSALPEAERNATIILVLRS